MEEGKLKRKKISAETTVEILFFLFLLVFYLMWARVQPMGAGPDEQMRYQIADYIYKHGSLPVGDDPSVRNVVWGISYAFSPILSYMIAAVFMKAVSFVTTAPFALLLAARFVNILFGLGTVWLVLDMGKQSYPKEKDAAENKSVRIVIGQCTCCHTQCQDHTVFVYPSLIQIPHPCIHDHCR